MRPLGSTCPQGPGPLPPGESLEKVLGALAGDGQFLGEARLEGVYAPLGSTRPRGPIEHTREDICSLFLGMPRPPSHTPRSLFLGMTTLGAAGQKISNKRGSLSLSLTTAHPLISWHRPY